VKKDFKLIFSALFLSGTLSAQNVAINGTGALPNTSAMLDVSSTSSGLLIPRMAAAQKLSIVSPATGLVVYQTTSPAGFWYYDGAQWLPLLNSATGWSILGNAGTNVSTNFLGTSDNNDLAFRVNNVRSGLIEQGVSSANTLFGYSALSSNTGSANTAYGFQSLTANTSGIRNTASGYKSQFSNTLGNLNNSFGYQSLYSNTTGGDNSAFGYMALYSNNNGFSNSAIGNYALYSNTNGSDNTAVGRAALNLNTIGSNNNAIGSYCMYNNISGSSNQAMGYQTLYTNTTGALNEAIGHGAMTWNTIGSGNAAYGAFALSGNTSGGFNTAIGWDALSGALTGSFNAAIGADAMYNTKGDHNSGIGWLSLYLTTFGDNNCAMGSSALYSNVTGDLNSALGYSANVSNTNWTNATAIGANAVVNASNKVRIGDVNVTSIGGQVGWTTFSDARYKINVKQNVPGLSFITKLVPVTYNVNTDGLTALYGASMDYKNPIASTMVHTGFLAQDVEKAAKELGFDFSGIDAPANDKALYGLRYSDFVVPMVKAMQEQQEMILELQKELKALRDQLNNK
jgi:hypothetical protein